MPHAKTGYHGHLTQDLGGTAVLFHDRLDNSEIEAGASSRHSTSFTMTGMCGVLQEALH
jgi:hypothetical protein